MTEQRDGCPSQSWSCCSTCPPNKHILGARTERRGLLGPRPPGCSPLGRAAWHLRLHGPRLPWARLVMVLQPLPAAQRGKKNAEPGKSLSVSSGVEGAGIDRAGAAGAWCCFGIGGARPLPPAPWVCSHPWPVPGPQQLRLCAYWCHHVI